MLKRHSTVVYVPHQRYVIDGNVATTTGITASLPTMLALVEAIGGRGKAQALANELGVESWTPEHDSSLFGLNASRMWNYVLNKAAFWRHQPRLRRRCETLGQGEIAKWRGETGERQEGRGTNP